MPTEASYAAFARDLMPELSRSATAMLGDRHHAEDLVQVTLERLWRRWHRLEELARPELRAYAHKVLLTQATSWRRKLSNARERPDYAAVLAEVASREDDHSHIWVTEWLSRLPTGQRSVVIVRYLLDFSVEDAAQVLGCSQGTIKSQTSRALASARRVIVREPVT